MTNWFTSWNEKNLYVFNFRLCTRCKKEHHKKHFVTCRTCLKRKVAMFRFEKEQDRPHPIVVETGDMWA